MNLEPVLKESRKTIRIGLPLVMAQLVQMSMGFVDTLMAGRLSAKDLAAVALGSSFVAPTMVFSIGVLMATNPIVAQLFGTRNRAEIGKNFWQSLWLSQFLALPCFLLLRNMQPVMEWLRIQPEVIPTTQAYLDAFSWGIPAAFAYFSLRFFNEGLAITRPTLYIALIGLVGNVFGNYVFMYGHFGVPAMGAVGTGWASALVRWIMLAFMLSIIFSGAKFKQFEIASGFKIPTWPYIREILRIGVPNGISVCIEVSMFAITAMIIGSLGVATVAAHQVAINFAAMTFMIPLGLSIATTARVGHAVGEGNPQRARLVGYVGIGLGTIVMCLTAVVIFSVPELIARIYTTDLAVIEVAVKLLFCAAIFQISDGIQVCVLGALRGYKDTKIPMFFNILAYWVIGLPTGYFLGMYRGFGAPGLWVGLIFGLTIAAILHSIRFYQLSNRLARRSDLASFVSTASDGSG